MPCFRIFFSVTCPTPKILLTGNLSMNVCASLGVMVNWPSGLFQSEAILARNLLEAMPADIVTPISFLTRSLISVAMRVALPSASFVSVTSRKASSRESGSTLFV